MTDSMSSRGV